MVDRHGAGEGIRTLDINLGKVALYQLSYARINLTEINYATPQGMSIALLTHLFPWNSKIGSAQ